MAQTNLKEAASGYIPKRTLNIADLDKVDVSFPIDDRVGTRKDGSTFDYLVMVINQQEYRVPATVLEELQKVLKLKPDTKFVKVIKTGSDLATRYSVEFLE